MEADALQYYNACSRAPYVYEGRTRAHVPTCITRVRGARTRWYYTCTVSPTADSVTVRSDPHYSSPLQYSGTVAV